MNVMQGRYSLILVIHALRKNLNFLIIFCCRQFMERENLQIHLRCKFTSQSRGDGSRAETNGGRGTVEDTELPGAKQKYKVNRSEIYIESRTTALKNILPNKKVRALEVPIGRRKQFFIWS